MIFFLMCCTDDQLIEINSCRKLIIIIFIIIIEFPLVFVRCKCLLLLWHEGIQAERSFNDSKKLELIDWLIDWFHFELN